MRALGSIGSGMRQHAHAAAHHRRVPTPRLSAPLQLLRRQPVCRSSHNDAVDALSLPTALPLYTVWGANTGVGKTLASVGLAHAAKTLQVPLLYVKPVQTGFPEDSDARLVAAACEAPLEVGPHAAALQPRNTQLSSHTQRHASEPLRHCKVSYAWSAPVSPHLAVQNEGRPVQDNEIVSTVAQEVRDFTARLAQHAAQHAQHAGSAQHGLGLVETAGGVASPGPSGRVMCDVLRPLRLPCILVGDPRLGGISATISAYESLLLRGYDVDVILLLDPRDKTGSTAPLRDQVSLHGDAASEDVTHMGHSTHTTYGSSSNGHSNGYHNGSNGSSGSVTETNGNAEALRAHLSTQFHRLGGPPVLVLSVPGCPPPSSPNTQQTSNGRFVMDREIQNWLEDTSLWFVDLVRLLQSRHDRRQERLETSKQRAMSQLWWPFTQHASLTRDAVQVVDSRCGEQLTTYQPSATDSNGHQTSSDAHTQPLFDAASSWWTQTVTAELQPELSRAVAYAAGRYLHVISPQVATQASLEAAERLLRVVGGDWATRVFFSDDGSTAIEIALKMAFRKYLSDRETREKRFGNGFSGNGTHSNGSSLGHSSDKPPELKVVGLDNAYHGDTLGAMDCVAPSVFNSPTQAPWYRGRGLFFAPPYIAITQGGSWQVVDSPQWLSDAHPSVHTVTWQTLDDALSLSRDYTPLADVYRQHIESALSHHDTTHTHSHLAALIIEPLVQGAGGMLVVDPLFQRVLVQCCRARFMPVIFDEVMAGLYRLGAQTAASLLGCAPDISCHAKLMTAGVVPGAATMTTEDVFNAFQGDSKLQALLHGHSYTAFPVGCAATIAALDILTSHTHNPNLCTPHGPRPTCPTPVSCGARGACGRLVPMWDTHRVAALAAHPRVRHAVAVGTVVAARLRAAAGAAGGYGSSAAAEAVTRLRESHGVYARPLGDVVYVMATPTTRREMCDALLDRLLGVLDDLDAVPVVGGRAVAQEVIV